MALDAIVFAETRLRNARLEHQKKAIMRRFLDTEKQHLLSVCLCVRPSVVVCVCLSTRAFYAN